MDHSHHALKTLNITGSTNPNSTEQINSIRSQKITDNANQNLSTQLEEIAGVSALKTGNGIAKPIVHGLYGNRITIINNGVTQGGQQWGNDHSPAIDPLVANKISVVKGSAALAYMGSNLGSAILIEPKKIEKEPHLHGRINYYFESNGLSNGLNVQLHQYGKSIGWKLNGSLRKSGDKSTANYYLNNTGSTEANLALQLEKEINKKWFAELFISTFNSQIGVLAGSHIGNTTDLQFALERDEPYFTEDEFSYAIEAPKQHVNHHLIKAKSKYFFTENNYLNITLAAQLNKRKEFDIRRGGRTSKPALSLEQATVFGEAIYKADLENNFSLNTGFQFNTIDNINLPETGILPLIPNYDALEVGAFAIGSKKTQKSKFQLGVRLDNVNRDIVDISNTLPREIVRYNNNFNNVSASFGWQTTLHDHFGLRYNLGYAQRNPHVNELFSYGLHQGVSGIEEGDINLEAESSIKTTLGFVGSIKHKLSFETLAYYQNIDNYIFLNPQNEVRLTIRGAFPVFKYEQTRAEIYGLDVSTKYEFNAALNLTANYAYIKGTDITNNEALINIPSNNLRAAFIYEHPQSIDKGKLQLNNLAFELNGYYAFEQNSISASQDYALPPSAYFLLGGKVSSDIQLAKTRLRCFVKGENILNTPYRDYLNRQRYFADDLGVNLILGIQVKL